MSHNHHHHEHNTKNIGITIVLNLVITIAQVIGGIISGSMALLSDAAHNFSDVFALIISYIARKLSGKELTETKTFGYKRAEIFAAFLNSAMLIGIAITLLVEGTRHLILPEKVNGTIVIWLAGLSILLNGLSVLLIKNDAKESINMKSAYLHLFTDMLTSIAVLAGGFVVKYLKLYWIDPALSLVIALYLIYMSWGIFKESIKIFMQFTPADINIRELANKIIVIQGVKNAHHIHIWKLDEHEIIFEAHIDTENNISITEFEKILLKIYED
ncbi:MAG: cation diffusion facilitator family transporter [Bacteroidales bacterium]|nr:cation diffusion facilitator family transporter [Bacteroidales bacterium]